MLKFIVAIIAVFSLIIAGIFFGVIPVGGLLDNSVDTISYKRGTDEWVGNKDCELLDKKAYILAIGTDGFSERITVKGRLTRRDYEIPWSDIEQFKYVVYLKENAWSTYEVVSKPGLSSMYLSNPNPGNVKLSGGEKTYPGYLHTYQFELVGDKYADGAIKVELWAFFDAYWFGDPEEWYKMSVDEAYLYSGYGGLYLPRGIEDDVNRPYDTFEIGQEVDIRVETAKGGYGTESPWRVTLNEPYSGAIDEPDDGGGVVLEKYYANDVTNGHFKFTVTEEMAKKSMSSSDPYSIRIWNVLLPKGTLYVDFLDFVSLAPSDVEFSVSGIQVKVGEKYSVGMTATSDSGVDYFRVSVIYGTNDVLLPSDPLSELWLVNTRNVGDKDGKSCTMPQTISFIPKYPSFITVHAKAFDLEGRGSVRTRTYTIWAYEINPVPDEVIDEETGEDDYGGGQAPGYLPWDPEGGNWENIGQELVINWTGMLFAFLIILGFALVGLFVLKSPKMIIIMVIAGIIIAILVYAWFFTNLFS